MDACDIRISIVASPFDADAECAAFRRSNRDWGAIVHFIGLVRSAGARVERLSIEHYSGLTESEVASRAAQAADRWPARAITIVHRIGELAPGDPIVFVAAASDHRRAAFETVDFLMDHLKCDAPFWKSETVGGAVRWVEPREEDRESKERWRLNDGRG